MVWRGLRRRCAACGGRGAFFTSWFSTARSCRTCGLRWQRGRGAFQARAGSVAVVLAFAVLALIEIPIVFVTWPSVPVLALVGLGVIVLVGAVALLYPVSFTTWQAFDLSKHPATVDDFELDHLTDGFGGLRVDADALAD